MHRLRDAAIPGAVAGTGARVYVGGPTATSIDSAADLAGRIRYLIVGVVMLLLLIGFRSVAVAVKAGASVPDSVTA